MRRLTACISALLVLAACNAGELPTDAASAASHIDPLAAWRGGGPSFRAADFAAGMRHTCALDPGGAAWCWGSDDSGRLGTGGSGDASTPLQVAGGLRFVEIDAAGHHTCGVTRSGEVWCWGLNSAGQLGDGTTTDRPIPVRVTAGGLRFTNVSAGNLHTCAVAEDGSGYCWGLARRPVGPATESALGAPTAETCPVFGTTVRCATTPLAVAGGLEFREIDAGLEGSCGLTTSGQVHCWGWNGWWQFGDGTDIGSLTPRLAASGMTFTSLAYGAVHACGLAPSGTAHCWGARFTGGLFGSLGTGSFSGSPVPVPVTGARDFTGLAVSRANNIFGYTCGVVEAGGRGGDALCWGSDRLGQLGNESDTVTCDFFPSFVIDCAASPVPVAGDIVFEQVVVGSETTCGPARDRAGWCWGEDASGELGTDTGLDSCSTGFGAQVDCALTPVRVASARGGAPAAASRGFTPARAPSGRSSDTAIVTPAPGGGVF